jgi:hypothetical protein
VRWMWRCRECGFRVWGGVDEDGVKGHRCHPDGVVRTQAARFDYELERWLKTPAGEFAVYYARRCLNVETKATHT